MQPAVKYMHAQPNSGCSPVVAELGTAVDWVDACVGEEQAAERSDTEVGAIKRYGGEVRSRNASSPTGMADRRSKAEPARTNAETHERSGRPPRGGKGEGDPRTAQAHARTCGDR